MRDHWLAVEEQTGQPAAILDGPEMPDALDYLWTWFKDLSAYRHYGFAGAEMIRPLDRFVYFLEESVRPERWEIGALVRLDDLYLSIRAEADRARSKKPGVDDSSTPKRRKTKG